MVETAWLYILASGRRGTLYVGSTTDLARRIFQHRERLIPGFTRTYGVTRLVFAEPFANIAEAYAAEQRIKRWRRAWKIKLIEERNPLWRDLYEEINW
jgi:putative endonuclease